MTGCREAGAAPGPIRVRDAVPGDGPVVVEFNRRLARETEGKELQADAIREGVDRLLGGVENVEQALVRTDLELFARFLVDVRRAVHREALDTRRQRNRARDAAAGAADRLNDFTHRLIEQSMIVGFQSDADLVVHRTSRS